jgi:hypothetical protein
MGDPVALALAAHPIELVVFDAADHFSASGPAHQSIGSSQCPWKPCFHALSCSSVIDSPLRSGRPRKFSPTGQHLWSKRFGDANLQDVWQVVVGPAGEIVLTGDFNGSIDFGGGPLTNGQNTEDTYLVKFTGDGEHVWSKSFDSAPGPSIRAGSTSTPAVTSCSADDSSVRSTSAAA